MTRYGRLARALGVLWVSCLGIFVAGMAVETLLHVHMPRPLLFGAALLVWLPFTLVFLPDFSGPPHLVAAAVFSVAVMLLAFTLRSIAFGEPFFGSTVFAAGVALLSAVACFWQGSLLWRAFRL